MRNRDVLASAAAATMGKRRSLALASACILSAVLSPAAATKAGAATIDTYDYAQGGYTNPSSPNATSVLSGSFTGTVEANGFIELADLTSISISLTITKSPFAPVVSVRRRPHQYLFIRHRRRIELPRFRNRLPRGQRMRGRGGVVWRRRMRTWRGQWLCP